MCLSVYSIGKIAIHFRVGIPGSNTARVFKSTAAIEYFEFWFGVVDIIKPDSISDLVIAYKIVGVGKAADPALHISCSEEFSDMISEVKHVYGQRNSTKRCGRKPSDPIDNSIVTVDLKEVRGKEVKKTVSICPLVQVCDP